MNELNHNLQATVCYYRSLKKLKKKKEKDFGTFYSVDTMKHFISRLLFQEGSFLYYFGVQHQPLYTRVKSWLVLAQNSPTKKTFQTTQINYVPVQASTVH